ncbi:hypothetical protein LOC68_25055 [Blastopirellula sp. JC732]|uniref:DUF4239 domain-containing protein n=1 Tax=Blastopirellula sediminis TaxID=2894196 RepID=A0A9X1SMH2_9BACT|nr:hypothetical protein [Blastopirellula sediminis]MCC9605021.1 hypothetical protein [Blastopirellula sediminis]MCC9631679.1 hypothetical protein [Blastopirellula sediminis]
MINFSPLEYVPLWALFLLTIVIVLAASEGGIYLGRRRALAKGEKQSSIGSVVGATLGLLAFMLAFTFGVATNRFDSRRMLFQEEVNAIGTTYLRTELLSETQGEKSRQLLRRYVDVRLDIPNSPEEINAAIKESETIQTELWSEAMLAAHQTPNSPMIALYVASLNDVIDLHSNRVTAAIRARIPGTIWLALYSVSVFSMASVGFYVGVSGGTRSIATMGMIFSFVVIMMLIIDLDRPREGLLRVNEAAMHDLQDSINR